jgi:dihydrodipicolinate synthase/N-acetylneuraminate lyase
MQGASPGQIVNRVGFSVAETRNNSGRSAPSPVIASPVSAGYIFRGNRADQTQVEAGEVDMRRIDMERAQRLESPVLDPIALIRPRRRIEGASAILLPFELDGSVDWPGFVAHARRTADLGLTPAVNMDTGYANLIDEPLRVEVLRRTRDALDGRPYLAGAFVGDRPGDPWNREAYLRQVASIVDHGGTPVVFQSHGLTALEDDALVDAYSEIGRHVDRFVAFELAMAFAPFGKIYSLEVFRGLMGVKSCIGAKHSSLHREPEWLRLIERDRLRPDFRVYTGNDLAIDMVMYGSDYLLGLSTFAPDAFARRDALWEAGDPAFSEVNDLLQYLGFLAFRPPVPAYKHSAAMFLRLRGWIASDRTHPDSPTRPDSDVEILRDIARRLDALPEH